RLNTSTAPSQSVGAAGRTARPQISPSVSTSRCRLRPATFFPPVVPLRAARLGRLDALAVDDRPAGGIFAVVQAADADAEDVVDLVPEALVPPGVEVVGDGLPGREAVRQRPPGTAAAGQVEDGVDDLTPGVSAVPPRLAGRLPLRREQVLDVVPLEVRQVTRISLSSAHTSRVGDDSAGWEGRFLDGHLGRAGGPPAGGRGRLASAAPFPDGPGGLRGGRAG